MTMAGELQPLAQNFKVVDENGFPTLYFIKWAQQRQIDISEGITLTDLQAYLTAHALREGSGIQFTPDGDLNNSPLIAADVQEILDQISATRGTVIYRGLLGWAALGPGTSGQFLKTQGAGADPVWATASGGGIDTTIQKFAADGVTTSFAFTAIPATYDELILCCTMEGGTCNSIRLNSVAGANYQQQISGHANGAINAQLLAQGQWNPGSSGFNRTMFHGVIPNYLAATGTKKIYFNGFTGFDALGSGNMGTYIFSGYVTLAAAVNRIDAGFSAAPTSGLLALVGRKY
jgi:hypothetical protein